MQTSFQHASSSPTYCGKTFYLLEMLERDYAGTFDYIVLLCPTILYNKTYHRWRYFLNPDFIALPVEQDSVDELLEYVVDTYKETNTLIILDDCASGNDMKNRTSELVKLGFSARHYGLSTIVLIQQLTSISKPFRENISKLVTFYNTNRKDMQTLINDYLNNVGKEEIENISKAGMPRKAKSKIPAPVDPDDLEGKSRGCHRRD